MSTTPATNLYTALLAAQRDYGKVLKNQQNPHLRNKYADLGAVLDAVTEPLAKHGVLLLQRFAVDQGGAVLVTELIHAESGQALTSTVPVVSKDPLDPQKVGSAITYYRRYSLLALLGLRAEDDDDGDAASKPAPRKQEERPRPAPLNAAPLGSPYDAAERERLARQVRRNDEALSPAEYQRHHELEALARQQGQHPAPPSGDPALQRATERQVKFAYGLAREAGIDEQELSIWSQELYGQEVAQLNRHDMSSFIEALQRRRNEVG